MGIMSRVVMIITTQEPQEKNYPITPKCKKTSGLRTFHSNATGLWNYTERSLRDALSQNLFLKDLQRKMI